MSSRLIRFPSIEQYRTVVHNVTSRARYIGKDSNGDAMYDHLLSLPTLKFQGTVKLHGTNAGVACDADGKTWCQSREHIITPQADNAGFAMFVHQYRLYFDSLFAEARNVKTLHGEQAVLIFGEWCGAGIQKKVALTQFPKMFVVFGVARVDEEGQKEWFTDAEIRIMFERAEDQSGYGLTNLFHIYQFPTYEIEIDFNRPHEAQNRLVEMTIAVENECPVAKQLGATADEGPLIGEGIVWKCVTPGYEDSSNWFKVKGEAHKADKTKTKVLTEVDVKRIDAIHALVEEVTPEWRLEQMYQETFNTINGGLPDIKRTGDYIKSVMTDVLKEELDVITQSGFTTRDITGPIAKIARNYLIKQLATFGQES